MPIFVSQETGMPLIKVQRVLAACATVLVCLGVAAEASAQSPGAPIVTVNPDDSVVLSYTAPVPPPAGTFLAASFNGLPLANIPIGTATTVATGAPVPVGAYTVQVVWSGSSRSDVVGFSVGVGSGSTPATTTLQPAVVSGSTVFLSWDPIPGATSYDIEAVFFNTGQRILFNVGTSSVSVPDVPPGNYGVRVRGRNPIGFGGFSNQILVDRVPTFRIRDLEVSLTWNTQADMDLHVIEPNGTHVWWKMRNGVTIRLDRDNTTGFGPETASIEQAHHDPGIYQIFIVHYRNAALTSSNITITLGVGSANPVTEVFSRITDEAAATVGYNVALVDVRTGVIAEQFGSRSVAPADEWFVTKPQQ
jgi:hypothetical protein